MEDFNKITIQELPKEDMLTIISALDYAAKHTKDFEYGDLKEQILVQLCSLAGCSEKEFLEFLGA
ncbi:hypothetical protein NSA47_12440 [Irregularibacter muris]|uniref:Uncharacterized protein n=1 Tax=Irregularibacter muris TaxID=1796619 RepID=A0AAE3HFS2_9FIRM|nr:hypothetical protein [Irregularibacter muris]MCR1899781.1 hypothetical protein [Irregularibacter muris]